jgi:hypothetical protein
MRELRSCGAFLVRRSSMQTLASQAARAAVPNGEPEVAKNLIVSKGAFNLAPPGDELGSFTPQILTYLIGGCAHFADPSLNCSGVTFNDLHRFRISYASLMSMR